MSKKQRDVEKLYKNINIGIIALLFVMLFIELLLQRWMMMFVTLLAVILIGFLLYFQKRINITLPPELNLIIVVFIIAGIVLGEIHDFYDRFIWWDSVLHTISGFIISTLAFGLLYVLYKNKKLIAPPSLIVFLSFSIAMTMGVFWEIFEFFMDQTFGLNMQRAETGVVDTMQDFIENMIGATVASILGYLYLKEGDSFIYRRLVKHFEKKNKHLFEEK